MADESDEHPACSHEKRWPPEYRNGANDPKETWHEFEPLAAHASIDASALPTIPIPLTPPSVPTTISRRSNTSAPTDPTPAATLLRRNTRKVLMTWSRSHGQQFPATRRRIVWPLSIILVLNETQHLVNAKSRNSE